MWLFGILYKAKLVLHNFNDVQCPLAYIHNLKYYIYMLWPVWPSWLGHHPAKQKVTVLIPDQGICLCSRFSSQSGCTSNQCFSLISMFLSLFLFLSLPSPVSLKKKKKSISICSSEDKKIKNKIYLCIHIYIEREAHICFSLLVEKIINACFLYGFREDMVKANKESKHSMYYSGRVKTLCLQKNTALWIGTGGGSVLLLDLSTRRLIRTIHNCYDSVRVMMPAQLGKFLSARFFLFSEMMKSVNVILI